MTSHWPVFLIDLLPQGFGRRELLHRLDFPETAEERSDWPLLLAGAGNSIGGAPSEEDDADDECRNGEARRRIDETIQDIEQGRSDGTVQTMNRIFGMLGLKLGVVRRAPQ